MDIFIDPDNGQEVYPWSIELGTGLDDLKVDLARHEDRINFTLTEILNSAGQEVQDIKEISSGDTLRLFFQENLPFGPEKVEELLDELKSRSIPTPEECSKWNWDWDWDELSEYAEELPEEVIQDYWERVAPFRKRQEHYARKIEKHFRADNRRKLKYYLHASQELKEWFVDLLQEGMDLSLYYYNEGHISDIWNFSAPLHHLLQPLHPEEARPYDYDWEVTFPQYEILEESEDEF